MVHDRNESDYCLHEPAFDIFKAAAEKALELKLYGAD